MRRRARVLVWVEVLELPLIPTAGHVTSKKIRGGADEIAGQQATVGEADGSMVACSEERRSFVARRTGRAGISATETAEDPSSPNSKQMVNK